MFRIFTSLRNISINCLHLLAMVSHICKLVSYLDEMLEFVSNGISYIYKRSGIIWIKCLNLLVMMFHI